jgi:RNA polymerase sigma factor (sigma-70 family)
VHQRVEAVWRAESAKITGALTRLLRDVGLAEELAQDAMVSALEQWPAAGVPDNPAAWPMAAAKHRAIDRLRHHQLQERKHVELAHEMQALEQAMPDFDTALDNTISDDVLRLMFIACHPVLATEARLALTLRLLGGLSTAEIARAFLVPEAAIAQRIVRAKRVLAEACVPFELPRATELAARLGTVLEVIYLIFNEGYTATAGEDWLRPALCDEALRLARLLAAHAPEQAEVQGLLALLHIQASRNAARVAADGTPILLMEQDRTRWSQPLIAQGLAALAQAQALGGGLGAYALQAAIAACHAQAATAAATDWLRIAALYDALAQLMPSPIVQLNRAVAVGMAYGPEQGLQLADALTDEPALAAYHLLPSVRGDLLHKLGRSHEAAQEFARAATLTRNAREQAFLQQRAAECLSLSTAIRH